MTMAEERADELIARLRERVSFQELPKTIGLEEAVPAIYWPKRWLVEALYAHAAAARREERERCAKVAESTPFRPHAR